MRTDDTTLGGGARAFPATHWSEILAVRDSDESARRERLGTLFQTYWKPVYAYVRVAWKKSNEDAKDLTQTFFARLLENQALDRIRAEGGSFRSYLRQALRNHLIDAGRSSDARKPVEAVVRFDPSAVDPPSPDDTPDQAFDRAWTAATLDAAIARLEHELTRQGKDVYFKAFRIYLLEPTSAGADSVAAGTTGLAVPTYSSIAKRCSVKESDIRNYLAHCRARLRDLLREEILGTAGSAEEAEADLANLIRR